MKTVVDIITGGTPGLIKDAVIIKSILGKEYDVTIRISRKRNFHLFFKRKILTISDLLYPKNRILLFLENIPENWLNLSSKSIFIPNQEWIRDNVLSNFKMCKEIWCKSAYAERIFENHFHACKYIGFSSTDMYLPAVEKNDHSFIHVAGRSHLKGTKNLLLLWQKHPEWPTLTIVGQNQNWHKKYAIKNIRYLTHFLAEEELKTLMNVHGIHICISEAEGFGHYIAEALSCKSVTITTNAPPMNELVDDATGILVEINRSEKQGLGDLFYVDINDLEKKIIAVLQMSDKEKVKMGEAARKSYLQKKLAFEKTFLFNFHEFVNSKIR